MKKNRLIVFDPPVSIIERAVKGNRRMSAYCAREGFFATDSDSIIRGIVYDTFGQVYDTIRCDWAMS